MKVPLVLCNLNKYGVYLKSNKQLYYEDGKIYVLMQKIMIREASTRGKCPMH